MTTDNKSSNSTNQETNQKTPAKNPMSPDFDLTNETGKSATLTDALASYASLEYTDYSDDPLNESKKTCTTTFPDALPHKEDPRVTELRHKAHQIDGAVTPSSRDVLHHKAGTYTLADYYALPEDSRVELIDGNFYDLAAPGCAHQIIAGEIFYQLQKQIREKRGSCLPFIAPVDVQLDKDDKTMVQPDLFLLCDRSKRKENLIFGAPEFVAEVLSPSTRHKDQFLKLMKYHNAGVQVYWQVDPKSRKVIAYRLQEDEPIPMIFGFEQEIVLEVAGHEFIIHLKEIESLLDA